MSTLRMLKLPWAQVDVFAEAPLEGNMLAIFTDAHGLCARDMQALARETNLSETTFVFPARDTQEEAEERTHGVRVRIFTTVEELPFAGHPTLGTAAWLRENYRPCAGLEEVRLRLEVGTIPVRFRASTAHEYGMWGEMRQRDPVFNVAPDAEQIAEALGLHPHDLHPSLHPAVVSTGLPFCVVPLRSVEAVERMHVQPAMNGLLHSCGAKFVYAIAQADQRGLWRTRMQFHGADDPATGSAAGCAISYLVRARALLSTQPVVFAQGYEMRRPSRIDVRASLTGDTVHDVFVGGRTIPVAEGRFTHVLSS